LLEFLSARNGLVITTWTVACPGWIDDVDEAGRFKMALSRQAGSLIASNQPSAGTYG
jgi:hypothetical protein